MAATNESENPCKDCKSFGVVKKLEIENGYRKELLRKAYDLLWTARVMIIHIITKNGGADCSSCDDVVFKGNLDDIIKEAEALKKRFG